MSSREQCWISQTAGDPQRVLDILACRVRLTEAVHGHRPRHQDACAQRVVTCALRRGAPDVEVAQCILVAATPIRCEADASLNCRDACDVVRGFGGFKRAAPERGGRGVLTEALTRLRKVLHERLFVDEWIVHCCTCCPIVLIERGREIVGCFAIGMALQREPASRRQIAHGLLRQTARVGTRIVICELVGVFVRAFAVEPLERLGDRSVQQVRPRDAECTVQNVAHERMRKFVPDGAFFGGLREHGAIA